jgi:flavin reductase (DIM6/NTAB) family NADH-FMN oxidoreductase RutF
MIPDKVYCLCIFRRKIKKHTIVSAKTILAMEKHVMEGVERYFATGVGLVTSTGSQGTNVMAVEWTLHISYEPMLIAIFIHEGSSTYANIMETKEFGVNMSSDEQAALVNIAGSYSRKEINKLGISMFKTYPGHRIKAPMIKGCVINAECIVISNHKIGDHVAIIGEVIDARFDGKKSPLIYHRGAYRKLGKKISSDRRIIRVNKTVFEEIRRMSKNAFTMRCIAALVTNGKGEKLLVKNNSIWKGKWTVPWFTVERGSDHIKELERYLHSINLNVNIKSIASIERLLFKHNSKQIRANFVVYRCFANTSLNDLNDNMVKWLKKIPAKTILKNLLNY